MASLRIPFPEKDCPSLVALCGQRITVGRLPQNAIQIRDRTISAYHAELIAEDDHYRVHDVGSTNAVRVNGELVTDFHLREPCKLTFGALECEFDPASPPQAELDPSQALLTRSDGEKLTARTAELEQTVTALKAQLEGLQPAQDDSTDRDLLVTKVFALTEMLAARDHELQELKAAYATLFRDRAVLQRALNELKANAKPSETSEPIAAAPAKAAPSSGAKKSTWINRPVEAVPNGPLPKPKGPLPHAKPPLSAPIPPSAPQFRPAA